MAQNVRSVVSLLTVGTVLWLVAGVIALAVNAQTKILWTCLAGVILGLIGIRYTIHRARRGDL
ncbi:MAG TPA: DUF2530 domain-containing protein [Candidatus Nanopelagicaceae bacterium]